MSSSKSNSPLSFNHLRPPFSEPNPYLTSLASSDWRDLFNSDIYDTPAAPMFPDIELFSNSLNPAPVIQNDYNWVDDALRPPFIVNPVSLLNPSLSPPVIAETPTPVILSDARQQPVFAFRPTSNQAIRLTYDSDGKSLIRENHLRSPCMNPKFLSGRIVDMSAHMESFLVDMLPRKDEDHSDWQPVDVTFDILSSRLKNTLVSMEQFRDSMTVSKNNSFHHSLSPT